MKINTTLVLALAILFFSIGLALHANGAESRRTVELFKTGEVNAGGQPKYDHRELLEPDQCGWYGCVIDEYYVENWDGSKWIYQLIDNDGDGRCDFQWAWKPIVDPTYGTFYGHSGVHGCGYSPHTELE